MDTDTKFTKQRYNITSNIYDLLEWPIEKLMYQTWRRNLWKKVEGQKILEIGVGTGKNIPHYPMNKEIFGIDLTEGMLRKAKRKAQETEHTNIHLSLMDVQDMSFNDNSFDAALATFVFCSVPNPIRGLKEALRVTKPGGKLYLLEHMVSENSFLKQCMSVLDRPVHFISGVHIARQTVQNVKDSEWTCIDVKKLKFKGVYRLITAVKDTKN